MVWSIFVVLSVGNWMDWVISFAVMRIIKKPKSHRNLDVVNEPGAFLLLYRGGSGVILVDNGFG